MFVILLIIDIIKRTVARIGLANGSNRNRLFRRRLWLNQLYRRNVVIANRLSQFLNSGKIEQQKMAISVFAKNATIKALLNIIKVIKKLFVNGDVGIIGKVAL